uniref:ALK and LTK ligand 1 n=1 Tax=Cavia porcellus TaxID=10141 RepID=A0A286XDR0_CAVPO
MPLLPAPDCYGAPPEVALGALPGSAGSWGEFAPKSAHPHEHREQNLGARSSEAWGGAAQPETRAHPRAECVGIHSCTAFFLPDLKVARSLGPDGQGKLRSRKTTAGARAQKTCRAPRGDPCSPHRACHVSPRAPACARRTGSPRVAPRGRRPSLLRTIPCPRPTGHRLADLSESAGAAPLASCNVECPREIFPRDLNLKDKFIKHFTGPVTFSAECSKHFHRVYHNTRDCSMPAYYKRCARLLKRLAVNSLCSQT